MKNNTQESRQKSVLSEYSSIIAAHNLYQKKEKKQKQLLNSVKDSRTPSKRLHCLEL